LVVEAKKLVTLQDFQSCPVWRYDEDDDLYHPVMRESDLPDSQRDVSIFAEFKTPGGHSFSGYVVGISRVFSVGLFCGDRTFHINKNIPDLSVEQVRELLACAGLDDVHTVGEFFPLEYRTLILRDEFVDFSGRFEISF
jgi:hypothetical protein